MYYGFLFRQSETTFKVVARVKKPFNSVKYGGSGGREVLEAARTAGNMLEQAPLFLSALWMNAAFVSPTGYGGTSPCGVLNWPLVGLLLLWVFWSLRSGTVVVVPVLPRHHCCCPPPLPPDYLPLTLRVCPIILLPLLLARSQSIFACTSVSTPPPAFELQRGPLRLVVAGRQGHLPRRLWEVSAYLSLDLPGLLSDREAVLAAGAPWPTSPRPGEHRRPRRGRGPRRSNRSRSRSDGGWDCTGAVARRLAARTPARGRSRPRLTRHHRAVRLTSPTRCLPTRPVPIRGRAAERQIRGDGRR